MRGARKLLAPMVMLAAGLSTGVLGPAVAQEQKPEKPLQESPSDLAREGLERMIRALNLLVESIPQYELPEVLENGDIIIRRKHPGQKTAEPEFDETAT